MQAMPVAIVVCCRINWICTLTTWLFQGGSVTQNEVDLCLGDLHFHFLNSFNLNSTKSLISVRKPGFDLPDSSGMSTRNARSLKAAANTFFVKEEKKK